MKEWKKMKKIHLFLLLLLLVICIPLVVYPADGKDNEVGKLIKALGDKDESVRSNARDALVEIGEPAVEPLIKALRNKNWDVRKYATEALGKIGDARAIKPLIEELRYLIPGIHVFGELDAVLALAIIGEPAVEPLIKALEDEDMAMRINSASALGKISDVRAVVPLIKALSDKEYLVRAEAAKALGKIGDRQAIEPLRKALEDKDEVVRRYTSEALEKLERR